VPTQQRPVELAHHQDRRAAGHISDCHQDRPGAGYLECAAQAEYALSWVVKAEPQGAALFSGIAIIPL